MKFIKTLQKLELKKGDIIVISYPGKLPPNAPVAIKESIKGVFPENKIVVLEDGMGIGILSPDNAED